MTLEKRIDSFVQLGEVLRRFGYNDTGLPAVLVEAAQMATRENPWFTPSNIRYALKNIGESLRSQHLLEWIRPYDERIRTIPSTRRIGIVAAGNIPAVAFHDMLCVLIAGDRLKIKPSSADKRLLPAIVSLMSALDPEWSESVEFTDGLLQPFDAIIATGSDNSARYFEYYFDRYPHIIRKNRISAALLSGNESGDSLSALATDIMAYFGLGCRNVSTILVPEGYDFEGLIGYLAAYADYLDHNKYRNNIDYNRTMFQLNGIPYLDAGTILLTGNNSFRSRISVLNYIFYRHPDEAIELLRNMEERLQCVVSEMKTGIPVIAPGKAQAPLLGEYADHIDTMNFLLDIQR